MKIIEGGVTAAQGFKAAGVYAGIKKKRKDMALVVSDVPCKAAGTFTTNKVKAAPVKWNQKIVNESEYIKAIVVNSGVANACTGTLGDSNNEMMAEKVASIFNVQTNNILVASTGVIGKQLPIDIIKDGVDLLIKELDYSLESGHIAAEAIMTTDTYSKEYAVQFEIEGKTITVGGMSKGSGMIHPNMATLLGFITTDINISKDLLKKALSNNVKDTYNMISVDGDTSTNDMVLILSNGMAGNEEITTENEDYNKFVEALNMVNTNLAKKMAADGEGATKLLEVTVLGADSKEQAIELSKSMITSNLCKTAIYGNDANWGRFLCAMGYSKAEFDPDLVDLYFESSIGKLKIVENGLATDYSEENATEILSQKEVAVIADLKMGDKSATAWGCDLTYDYIKINADYRS